MDRSIGEMLRIPEARIETLVTIVTEELKAAILRENSISSVKASTIAGVLIRAYHSDQASEYEAAFIGMMVEQAYNAAVLASKRGPMFPEKIKNK